MFFQVTLTRQSLDLEPVTGYPVYGFVSMFQRVKKQLLFIKSPLQNPETIDFRYITDGNAQTTQLMILLMVMVDFVVKSAYKSNFTIKDPFEIF
jgi:hypothetical protein